MALAYAVTYSVISTIKLRYGLYDDIDLAIFTQAVDGVLRGTVYGSIRGMAWPGDHASLVLFPLAPLYALWRSPLLLLVVQSLALALGAVPAYRIAARELGSRGAGIVFAAAYLLYPAVGFVNLFEFHPEALSVTPLLLAFDALRTGRLRATGLWLGLAVLGREDVALVAIAMAVHALIARTPDGRRAAGICAGIGVLSLLVTFAVLRPAFAGPEAEYGLMYRAWGQDAAGVVRGVLTRPLDAIAALWSTPGIAEDAALKRQYWLHLLGPLAFLPLLSPSTLLIALPVVFEHMLSARPAQHAIVFQYAALVVPFMVAAAAIGLGNVLRTARRAGPHPAALAVILVATLAGQALFGPLTSLRVAQDMPRPQPIAPSQDARAMQPHRARMLAQVAGGAGVVAGFGDLPALAGRANAHSAHHVVRGTYTFSREPYPTPEGIGAALVDFAAPGLMFEVNDGTARRWWDLFARNRLAPADAAGDRVLFLRDAPLIDLCAVSPDTPSVAAPATFTGGIELLGHDPAPAAQPGEAVPLRGYWRRTPEAGGLRMMELVLMDDAGRVALRRFRHLGYTVFPPGEWPPGATVRENYRLVLPGSLAPGRYRALARLWSGDGERLLPASPEVAPGGFGSLGDVDVRAP